MLEVCLNHHAWLAYMYYGTEQNIHVHVHVVMWYMYVHVHVHVYATTQVHGVQVGPSTGRWLFAESQVVYFLTMIQTEGNLFQIVEVVSSISPRAWQVIMASRKIHSIVYSYLPRVNQKIGVYRITSPILQIRVWQINCLFLGHPTYSYFHKECKVYLLTFSNSPRSNFKCLKSCLRAKEGLNFILKVSCFFPTYMYMYLLTFYEVVWPQTNN